MWDKEHHWGNYEVDFRNHFEKSEMLLTMLYLELLISFHVTNVFCFDTRVDINYLWFITCQIFSIEIGKKRLVSPMFTFQRTADYWWCREHWHNSTTAVLGHVPCRVILRGDWVDTGWRDTTHTGVHRMKSGGTRRGAM